MKIRGSRLLFLCLAFLLVFPISACQSSPTTDFSKLATGQKNIRFGSFTWEVLDVQEDKALLITEDVIDQISFNDAQRSIDWSGSDVRHYLNNKFLNQNFSDEDAAKIVEVMNRTYENEWFGTSGGGDTLDKFFLLSIDDVVRYYGDSGMLTSGSSEGGTSISDEFDQARIAQYEGKDTTWWLRSPGDHAKSAAVITSEGVIEVGGYEVQEQHGLRPAVCVKTS